MTANNIILFPTKNSHAGFITPPQTLEEVDKSVDMIKHVHIQETLEVVVPMLFDNLTIAGFNPSEEDSEFLKDGALIVEAIRSLLSKLYAIDHPLQLVAKNLFVATEGIDSYVSVSDNVKIVVTTVDATEGKS